MRSLEVAVPAFILALPLFFCFIWPFVYPVPKPVGGSILNSGLPILSPGHIFGTDTVGNDIMSRILYGGRVSFEVAADVQVIGLVVGGLLGLFIAHDLVLVKQVSDRVAVMYLGELCKIGPVREIYREPLHPYTLALLRSIPSPDPSAAKRTPAA